MCRLNELLMTKENPLVRFAARALTMGATTAASLWILLGVFGVGLKDAAGCQPDVCDPATQGIQLALIKKGYWIGYPGADGSFNEATITALNTFQDNNALSVQLTCDQQCRTALRGSPWPFGFR
jgi:peptidoglycan hydrolase-like protein with peptidoglycan-binding domain